VAAALDFSHHHDGGIVHRDIKPGNILFDDAGRTYLSDYGLSYLLEGSSRISTTTGQFVGTPSYASPEQCQGLDADRRSDVYSLGIMLYEMLTGTLPYPDASPVAVLLMHIQAPPPDLQRRRPDLPPACAQVVAKALAKDPGERFGSAGELRQAWQTALAQDQAVVVIPAGQGTAAKPVCRAPPVVGEAPISAALPGCGERLAAAGFAGFRVGIPGVKFLRPAPGMTGEFNVAVAEFASSGRWRAVRPG
jgi:serine/threonine-protein kinase